MALAYLSFAPLYGTLPKPKRPSSSIGLHPLSLEQTLVKKLKDFSKLTEGEGSVQLTLYLGGLDWPQTSMK